VTPSETHARFRIDRLGNQDRTGFDCGVEPLNEYFRDHVTQDVRRRVSACYVCVENRTGRIAGYYTLAATGVSLVDLPPAARKRLPRYPTVPAVLIGRLAIDLRFRGRRLGGVLLFDAISRTCTSGIGAYAVIVDAKDDQAVGFYECFGFQRFQHLERRLFLPISNALKRLVADSPSP